MHNLGVRPDPFWDNRSIFSGLNAGEYSSTTPSPVNGTIGVCAYRLGLKTDFCHRGRVPRLVGGGCLTAPSFSGFLRLFFDGAEGKNSRRLSPVLPSKMRCAAAKPTSKVWGRRSGYRGAERPHAPGRTSSTSAASGLAIKSPAHTANASFFTLSKRKGLPRLSKREDPKLVEAFLMPPSSADGTKGTAALTNSNLSVK